MSQGQMVFTTL